MMSIVVWLTLWFVLAQVIALMALAVRRSTRNRKQSLALKVVPARADRRDRH